MSAMKSMPDKLLVLTYNKAKELKLDNEFLLLLKNEILNRSI
ncbi:sporulation histidine kinase inhibitor Sda [Virgibacillus halophilus]|uniref:Sporulation histidine kinase inhibitor Sda n=1 Tax=Tigheibacillus halophilus TaxID=361280 RepID=A0ABU5CBR8_9BACI|nr:sporulation histidine kinase inhibitor Sda [Virgibacillus halophilus]